MSNHIPDLVAALPPIPAGAPRNENGAYRQELRAAENIRGETIAVGDLVVRGELPPQRVTGIHLMRDARYGAHWEFSTLRASLEDGSFTHINNVAPAR